MGVLGISHISIDWQESTRNYRFHCCGVAKTYLFVDSTAGTWAAYDLFQCLTRIAVSSYSQYVIYHLKLGYWKELCRRNKALDIL